MRQAQHPLLPYRYVRQAVLADYILTAGHLVDDPTQAAKTRREFVERHADSGALMLAAHFPRAGHM